MGGMASSLLLMKYSPSLFVAALVASVSASNVLELDTSNWDNFVGRGKPGLVQL